MARWGILCLALCSSLGVTWAATLGVVYTEGGFVEGESKKLGLFGSYVDIFKGIPFAAPPKILQDPEPHPGWDGTLKAKSFKDRCMQMTLTQTDVNGIEDCLYLNMWIPQARKQVSTNLPVMVFIYGGAFLVGGSQGANFLDNYLYDGEEIAVRGNVIVVTINYRLGPLGFLSTGDENMPGNYGLKDQHMAIAWVKRNIKAFGGDPENITIFGESAGAVSVSLQLGEKLGCSTDNTTILASCLRAADPKKLTLAYHLQLTNLPTALVHTLALTPVVDGDFLPDMPENLFANAADIDYLVGVNDMDGHIFAGIDLPDINAPLRKVTADPNKGNSDVPVSWPAYSSKGTYYLEINNNINKNSVKQDLRSRFVTFWNSVYRSLPQVANITQSGLMF
ncbi:PREDICTED: bile salt-activated lipase [Lepidothrix coronata]|uniref:Carboxylic ester hydrolase n=1 Tax=Lepidothrix coronata TaxID=321398 RepID=A0A6J0GUB6_9PASS|nr:PREDICTED: bile salt-activated lipase [Lepidothrix coronata]